MREELIKDKVYQEVPYQNPRNGLYFELHMDLFPQESGAYGHFNQLFEDAFDTCMETDIQGSKVLTLNPKQHFFISCMPQSETFFFIVDLESDRHVIYYTLRRNTTIS